MGRIGAFLQEFQAGADAGWHVPCSAGNRRIETMSNRTNLFVLGALGGAVLATTVACSKAPGT